MYTIDVIVPNKLSLNKYHTLHHQKLHAIKYEFYQEVLVAPKKGVRPRPPYYTHYHFILWGAQLDQTNLVGMVKPLEDGLVKCGVLIDDSPEYVKSVTVTQEKATDKAAKKKINRCIITITHGEQTPSQSHIPA